PVVFVNLPRREPHLHELLDQQTCSVAVDVQPPCENVLFDTSVSGRSAQVHHCAVLQRRKPEFAQQFGGFCPTNLMKATRCRDRHAVPWPRNVARHCWRSRRITGSIGGHYGWVTFHII